MTRRYFVQLERVRAGRYVAVETSTGVRLGAVSAVSNEGAWFVHYLMGRDGLVKHTTLEAVRCELERYCRAHPDEIDASYRRILALRARATSTEPVEPAPVLQGVMPL